MTEPAPLDRLQAITDALLAELSASRTTIRLAVDGGPPTTLVAESRATGVRSMRDGPQPAITAAPTYVYLEQQRRILVQADCRHDPPAPPASLIEDYGVLAQMLAPVLDRAGTALVGTISVHSQGRTRTWTVADVVALAAAQVAVIGWYADHEHCGQLLS
jgi:GAF domain-containing protein